MEPPAVDIGRARAVLERLAHAVGDGAVLWRGPELDGADVDVLAAPGSGSAITGALAAAGLVPRPGDPGHLVWAGEGVAIDVLAAGAWPSFYPSFRGLSARAAAANTPLPVASEQDRLLIFAADALGGRPLGRLAARARGLMASPGVADRMWAVAREEGLEDLARLAGRLAAGGVGARRGRLPYTRAISAAAAGRAARRVLAARLAGRARAALRRPRAGQGASDGGRSRRGGGLIVVCGMDGAGKSTAAGRIRERLAAAGIDATVAWSRFGQEANVLDRIAGPAKRVLRRGGTIADPVAAGGPRVAKQQHPAQAAGRRSPLAWAWVCVVALVNARTLRRAARARRGGAVVVCDRWVTDSLVDLELRYGRHPVAELLLSRATPRPDLGLLLDVDAETASRRKPEDQARRVLEGMERLYPRRAEQHGLVPVPASGGLHEVVAVVDAIVDGFAAGRAPAEPRRPH